MEIIYVHEGSGRFHIAYDYFNSQPGDIILIKPNALHAIHPLENRDHRFESLNFNLDLVGYPIKDQVTLNYLKPLNKGQLGLIYRIVKGDAFYDDIKALFFQLHNLDQAQPPYADMLIKAKLQELLYYIFAGHHAFEKEVSQAGYRKEEKIRAVINYITHNYRKELTINQLADLCGYSPTHFMNFFKKNLGTTCMDYLIQFRLSRAAEMLEQSNRSVLEISHAVGFNNLSNFNRQFKKTYKVTPSQYRKQI